ncbi:LptF/LptG family permease [bacterium]|nr:LptF/LptG family permease [bacterium]
MKLIDRYIISKSIWPFVYCMGVFLVIMVCMDLFENLDSILQNNVDVVTIVEYYLLLIPGFAVEISPLCLLLGSVYILGKLLRHNEITAMRACGINIFRVIAPFLYLGLIVSLVVIILNETFIPKAVIAHGYIKEKYLSSGGNKEQGIFRNNIAFISNNYSYFVKKYDVEKMTMYDITILKYDKSDQLLARIDSKKGEWTGTGWRFYDGMLRSFLNSDEAGMESFKEKFINLPEKPSAFAKSFDLEFMTYREIKNYIKKVMKSGAVPIKERVFLYSRVAMPFSNFVILMVGIPIVFMMSQAGIISGIVISLVVSFLYKIILVVGIAFGNGQMFPPFVSAWFGNAVFFVIGVWLLKKVRV